MLTLHGAAGVQFPISDEQRAGADGAQGEGGVIGIEEACIWGAHEAHDQAKALGCTQVQGLASTAVCRRIKAPPAPHSAISAEQQPLHNTPTWRDAIPHRAHYFRVHAAALAHVLRCCRKHLRRAQRMLHFLRALLCALARAPRQSGSAALALAHGVLSVLQCTSRHALACGMLSTLAWKDLCSTAHRKPW